ncbi:NAD-dependent epimerase/dehydratase family protein [Halorubrum ezzemoulense]|uniref:NAD-dependent epimerase/dehydratase family protein n=1 Tax=Halorubrum ezzemoulense TaxID=337243 RepID=UPI00232F725D|nr:NAD-dependent epimerase/dehydratase family protein [Halorubrum ezzemoulense]MDB2250572.1 NAD-dependent epimerase/dehydratase family protein [Halorubrum ezzemoulense]MDB2285978.1 NAD-dependent epimerase/dehydratase family protein [Halorubrum ezzemoulense]
MSILVTGGAGFLGSHLVELLLSEGYAVTVIDDESRGGSDNLAAVSDHSDLTIINTNLTEYEDLENLVSDHSKVYHLAARIGGVGYLRKKPATIITENDYINKRVFEACVEADIDRLLFASSSMLYAEADCFPTPESMATEIPPPPGSYGFQKLNGEYYCDAYHREYGLEYVAPRIFNAVGPRDWPSDDVGHGHVVPDMVRKIVTEKQDPVTVKGSGQQTRCFTDVRDTVRGLYRCMEEPEAANKAINIGATRETSIIELVEEIWKVSGRPGQPQIDTESGFEKDVTRRVPDCSKAEEFLGWAPRHELEETLTWYIDSYKTYYE